MPPPYSRVNLAEVQDVAPEHGFGERWEARGARTDLAAEQTGVFYFRLKPGKRSPFVHRHERAEEVYLVVRGTGRMKLGDDIIDVAPLDTIRVSPELARAFEAGPDGLDFVAFGPHHAGDGQPVDDPWSG